MVLVSSRGLGKRFGRVVAVEDASFDVQPGLITGLLGPNGSGKSTTMQLMVGLTRGDGACTFDGRPFRALQCPRREVGVMMGSAPFHLGRTGRSHLRMVAAASDVPRARVAEVLDLVDLRGAETRRIGTYSLGMKQRLSLATALLGDPPVLVLDEPSNGLDPLGVKWFRDLMRQLAGEGRAILVSSHVLTEAAFYVDHVVILDRGRVRVDDRLESLVGAATASTPVKVAAADCQALLAALTTAGMDARPGEDGQVLVHGSTRAAVGEVAARSGLPLLELAQRQRTLEDVFMEVCS